MANGRSLGSQFNSARAGPVPGPGDLVRARAARPSLDVFVLSGGEKVLLGWLRP